MRFNYEWVLKEKGIFKYYRDPRTQRMGILLVRISYLAIDQLPIYVAASDYPVILETLTLHAFVRRYLPNHTHKRC